MASEREVQAARDAVVEAAQDLISRVTWGNPETVTVDAQRAYKLNRALTALRTLDALQVEPPEDAEQCGSPHGSCVVFRIGDLAHCQTCNKHWSESAEPELPPRNAEWRALMARVDHEGGC